MQFFFFEDVKDAKSEKKNVVMHTVRLSSLARSLCKKG